MFLTALVAVGLPQAQAQLPADMFKEGSKYAHAELVALHDELQLPAEGSQTFTRIGVHFKLEPGWHIYWKNSGETAIPTKVTFRVSNGWKAGELHWPAPQKFIERGNIIAYGYRDETFLSADLEALSPEAYNDPHVEIEAEVQWLVCKDICIPGKVVLNRTFELVSSASKTSGEQPLFARFDKQVPKSLEELQRTPKFSALKVNVFHAKSGVVGSTVDAILQIQNLPVAIDIADIGAAIQIFPDPSVFAQISQPEAAQTPGGWLIHLPVQLLAGTKKTAGSGTPVDSMVSGIAVISGAALGLDYDPSFTWAFPVAVHEASSATKPAGPDQDVAQLLMSASGYSPLVFRVTSSEDMAHAAATAAEEKSHFWLILLYGFLGGMLLNFMPCVLPVIGIKVMGLLGHGDLPRKTAWRNALAFASGIMLTLLTFAVVIQVLRVAGVSIGWGSQFQYPPYVLALVVIVFVLSLGFFDVYCVSLPGMHGFNTKVESMDGGVAKHFFDGVLATALSTPCTAPFLGAALVFAFSQGTLALYTVFIAIGLGLALPYVFLVTHPALLHRLPKPGMWMVHLRQLMGFALLGTVLWLLFVLEQLAPNGAIWGMAILLSVYFCFWLGSVGCRGSQPRPWWNKLTTAAVVLFGLFVFLPKAVSTKSPAEQGDELIHWGSFSEAAVAEARLQKRAAFIDFTADWCLTCKANENLIIETAPVAAAIKQHNIVALKADWTRSDPVITDALQRFGGRGVPLYVVLPIDPAKPPFVLSTIPSRESLIEAFKQANILASK